LLVARRARADKDAPPKRGRPPAFSVNFEAATLLTLKALLLTMAEQEASGVGGLEEPPSAEKPATWRSLAMAMELSEWQARKTCSEAILLGPQPPLPPGYNFTQSRFVRPGLSCLLHTGVYSTSELADLTGAKEGAIEELYALKFLHALDEWGMARAKAGLEVVKQVRGQLPAMERETADKVKDVAHGADRMERSAWVAVCSALRRIAIMRQGYVSMPESALDLGTATQASRRLQLRHATLQAYILPSLATWSSGYAPLDLAQFLSDENMTQLRGQLRYGEETPLLQVRREVLFSRLGFIDRFVDSQVRSDSDRITYPLEIDHRGEVPAHVEEALLPLLLAPTGLTNRATGRELDGRELFLSEVLTDRPWPARQALLRAVFDSAISPWTW
jgi:hypothetical protein